MKTLISALISCSLMLGAIAMAQQDQEQQKGKKKKSQQTSESQPQAGAAEQGQQQAGAQHGKGTEKGGTAHKEHTATTTNAPTSTGNADVNATQEGGKRKGKAAAHTETSPAATENANVTATQEGGKRKGKAAAHTETSPAATENANVTATQEGGKHKGKHTEAAAMKTGSPAATTGTAAAGAAAGKANKPGTVGKNGKQVNAQQVQQIKAQHTNFHAQPQPQKVKSVTYNQNYRIVEAQNWQGPQYEVFRAYTPVWHDAGWYRSTYPRVELIGGGYYYFNNGYWYPAWGYDPGAQYYAYDGPIYAGSGARPADQVVADVQAELKDMGYYTGEVDGLLGPLTREALTAYQSDHGLYATATIDEPTLDTLGLS